MGWPVKSVFGFNTDAFDVPLLLGGQKVNPQRDASGAVVVPAAGKPRPDLENHLEGDAGFFTVAMPLWVAPPPVQ